MRPIGSTVRFAPLASSRKDATNPLWPTEPIPSGRPPARWPREAYDATVRGGYMAATGSQSHFPRDIFIISWYNY